MAVPDKQNQPDGGDDTASIARLDTAQKLQRKFESMKRSRQVYERQWKLNLAFYKGRQWSYIDRNLGRIVTLATEEGDKPRFRVRIVSNQIVSGAQSLMAKLTKTKPVITATPGSSSDSDIKAAQMAESLLEHWWDQFHMEDLEEEAIMWGIIAGQGYWKITWDDQAGTAMTFTMDPQTGEPIVDDARLAEVQGMMAMSGQQPQTQTVYLGDIKVEAMSPFDVYLDPSAKTFSECKYAICVHHLTPDEIKSRWGFDVSADSVPTQQDAILPFSAGNDSIDKTVRRVMVAYFKPQPALPKGRYVVWVAEPNKILQDDPWPYPTHDLPLVKFPGIRVPGQVLDASVVETAIPLQKELNKTISQIVEYKNLTIKPRVWAPVGSIRQRITNEPGAVYEFTPIAGLKPEIETLPSMPPYVFQHLEDISQRLKEVFSLQDVTEGTVPPNVEAGVAIDLLQEMATDKLAPTIRLIELALERAGNIMLGLAQRYYIEPRMLKIKGSGGSLQVQKFTQADITGGVSVSVEGGSGLPRTRAGRQARIQSYVDMGVLKPDQAWKYLDIGDLKGVAKIFQADEDMAYREHDKLIKGIPINSQKAQEAIQQASGGINPNTGYAFQSDQEIQQYIEEAAFGPLDYENSEMHLDTHGLFMKSVEFEGLPLDVQARFLMHYSATFQRVIQIRAYGNETVKTTMQLKGTIGPTGAASILAKQGNPDITPDVMAEPPLETWVSNDLDKPDASGTGNNTAQEQAQYQQQAMQMQQQMAAQQAQMVQQAEAHSAKQTQQHEAHQQKLAQSDQLHGAKLRMIQAQQQAQQAKAQSPVPTGQ